MTDLTPVTFEMNTATTSTQQGLKMGQDALGNVYPYSVDIDNTGVPISAINPKQVQDAAAEASLVSLVTEATAILAKLNATLTVSGSLTVNTISGFATSANQPALSVDGGSLAHITNFPATQSISGTVTVSNASFGVSSLPALPAGTNTIGAISNTSFNVGTVTTLPAISIAASQSVGLSAGSNLVGKVGIDQTTVGTTDSVTVKSTTNIATQTLTRPANTTAYGAGAVIGVSTSATSAIAFATIGNISSAILITDANLLMEIASVPSGMTNFRLHLYNVTPPSAYVDGATWDLPSGDWASYLGYVDLGSPVDVGSALFVQNTSVNKTLKMGASTTLYGYIVTNGGFTPASGAITQVQLAAMGV